MTNINREISETAATLRRNSISAVEDLAAQAKDTMATATEKAKEVAEVAATEVQRKAEWAKEAVADGVAQVSASLRGSSAGDLASRAKTFAKDNPALVVAGLALVGFALTRFLRADPVAEAAADRPDIKPRIPRPAVAKSPAKRVTPKKTADKAKG